MRAVSLNLKHPLAQGFNGLSEMSGLPDHVPARRDRLFLP